jgi:hypothetical protein
MTLVIGIKCYWFCRELRGICTPLWHLHNGEAKTGLRRISGIIPFYAACNYFKSTRRAGGSSSAGKWSWSFMT